MFDDIEIQTFELKDLVGRNLDIKSYSEEGYEIISAIDTKTNEIFVLWAGKSLKPTPRCMV